MRTRICYTMFCQQIETIIFHFIYKYLENIYRWYGLNVRMMVCCSNTSILGKEIVLCFICTHVLHNLEIYRECVSIYIKHIIYICVLLLFRQINYPTHRQETRTKSTTHISHYMSVLDGHNILCDSVCV